MIDASSKPFAENIEITKKVVEYAHDHGVVVEAELGTLAGIEDEVKVAAHEASYTRPEEVEEFVSKTGCDSLAIAIGTSHGAYKFKPEQCTRNEQGILVPPPLRFDVLKEVSKRLPGFPIVLHGSSSVPQDYVKMINDNGGKMPNAIGVPEDQLREAAKLSVCKINIDSDLRLAMTGTIRQFFNEHPDKFDPREYLKPARANIKELVRHKLVDVLGSPARLNFSDQKLLCCKAGEFFYDFSGSPLPAAPQTSAQPRFPRRPQPTTRPETPPAPAKTARPPLRHILFAPKTARRLLRSRCCAYGTPLMYIIQFDILL